MPLAQDFVLRLVGIEKIVQGGLGLTDEVIAFHAEFFRRMREIETPEEESACVRYEGPAPSGGRLIFLGVAVPEIARIPSGMTAWILGPSSWERLAAAALIPADSSRREIVWRWTGRIAAKGARAIPGDFYARNSSGETGKAAAGEDFQITGYSARDIRREFDDGDRVFIAPYNPAWPREYARFAGWLVDLAGPDLILRTEHYGSTAIPGMPAKPIVDVLAEAPSLALARERLLPLLLQDARWEFWLYEDHIIFIRREKFMGARTHHLHVVSPGHPYWGQLAFRNYLRTHAQEAQQYARLKRDLAREFSDDRERYTQAKSDFIQGIMKKTQSGEQT